MENMKKRPRVLRGVGMVIVGVVGAAAFALAFGAIAMVLWNWLMPVIFGLTTISFWQAFGIVLLAKLLFGFGGIGGHDHDCKPGGKKIRSEIGDEIRSEVRKEWKKGWDKEMREEMRDKMRRHFYTKCADDVYEDWWEKEGAASFEAYTKQAGDKDADE